MMKSTICFTLCSMVLVSFVGAPISDSENSNEEYGLNDFNPHLRENIVKNINEDIKEGPIIPKQVLDDFNVIKEGSEIQRTDLRKGDMLVAYVMLSDKGKISTDCNSLTLVNVTSDYISPIPTKNIVKHLRPKKSLGEFLGEDRLNKQHELKLQKTLGEFLEEDRLNEQHELKLQKTKQELPKEGPPNEEHL